MASMQVEKKTQEHIVAVMKNQTPSVMHCERYAKFTKPGPGPLPPASIKAGGAVTFTGFVSKGAVVYTGHNKEQTPTSWLLAWDTTSQSLIPPGPNKVFVACGRKDVISKMTDDDILNCLNAATSPEAVSADPITKATVRADLNIVLATVENALNATFGLII